MTASSDLTQPDQPLISPAAAELLAKLIVLVAALLPVAGVAIRTIGFAVDPNLRNVVQLAVALPIVDLTALAAWSLLVPVISLVFVIFTTGTGVRAELRMRSADAEVDKVLSDYDKLGRDLDTLKTRVEEPDPVTASVDPEDSAAELTALQRRAEQLNDLASEFAAMKTQSEQLMARLETWRTAQDLAVPGWLRQVIPVIGPVASATTRLPRRIRIALAAIAFAALALFTPSFPLILVLLPPIFLAQALLTRSIRAAGDFRLRHAWPALAVFMGGYILAAGLTYTGPAPATYQFSATSGVQTGRYAELGRTDAFIYLRPCDDPAKGSIGVPVSAISLIELPPSVGSTPLRPSLFDLLHGNQTLKLGSSSQCDRP